MDNLKVTDKYNLSVGKAVNERLKAMGWVRAVGRYKDGRIKFVDEGKNLIVNTGLNYILNNDLAAASNFIGLLGAGTPAAGWTMTQAGGSTGAPSDSDGDREIHAEYDESTRPAWTVVDSTAQSVTNTASPAVFTFNASISVTGAFLASVATKNNQTGVLIGAKLFSSAKAMDSGETLTVTYAISLSSS
jgi:hypothetical protein